VLGGDVDQARHWSVARWSPRENFKSFYPAVPAPLSRFAHPSVCFQPGGPGTVHTWLTRCDPQTGRVPYLAKSQPGLCALSMLSDDRLLAIEFGERDAALAETRIGSNTEIRFANLNPGRIGRLAKVGAIEGHVDFALLP
jgi:hypothetical protein